jgi:hypothetical protein
MAGLSLGAPKLYRTRVFRRREALTVTAAVFAIAACGGPMSQIDLDITPAVLAALVAFRRQPKFEPTDLYAGFQPPSDRAEAEAALNGLIDTLVANLPKTPTKQFVLAEFAKLLPTFEDDDTEDREQLCMYLKRIKEIVGIKSLDGLLNRWLYGFDPTGGKGD